MYFDLSDPECIKSYYSIYTDTLKLISTVAEEFDEEDYEAAFRAVEWQTKNIKPISHYLERYSDYPKHFKNKMFGDSSQFFLEDGDGDCEHTRGLPLQLYYIEETYSFWDHDIDSIQDMLRNFFGLEFTMKQVKIAKHFLFMIYSRLYKAVDSYERIILPERKPLPESYVRRRREMVEKNWARLSEKSNRGRDFIDGKINEHGEYYNEGDK